MLNIILLGAAYLFVALGLENGVFPLFGESFGFFHWGEAHLVAMGVILAGMIRGEYQAWIYGLVCALIAGAVPGPGYVGPTLISFSVVAFGGALASRWFFVDRFGVRFVTLSVLLMIEPVVRIGTHQLLWGVPQAQMSWLTSAIVGLFAAAIYPALKRSMGERSLVTRTIGRRKLSRGR